MNGRMNGYNAKIKPHTYGHVNYNIRVEQRLNEALKANPKLGTDSTFAARYLTRLSTIIRREMIAAGM